MRISDWSSDVCSSDLKARVAAHDVNVYYGDNHALKHVDIDIHKNEVVAFIGPSGCGKSTFLRCINRMNDVIEGCRVTGEITLDGHDIYTRAIDVVQRSEGHTSELQSLMRNSYHVFC